MAKEKPSQQRDPEAKVRVAICARSRPGENFHKSYWAAGMQLPLPVDGKPSWVEVEVTPLELSWLKADMFIVVHEDLAQPAPAVTAVMPPPKAEDPKGASDWGLRGP